MKIHIKGKSALNLTKSNFLAAGGEGSVYVQGHTAYKIYADIKKTIPEGKIKELSVLTLPNIIRPEDILVNETGNNCGYSMKYVNKNDVFTVCELYTKAFKDRNQLTPDKIVKLIQIFQNTLKHCHDNGILVVDVNEMNFLVPKTYDDFFFIDTDSYQTKTYPATAIKDSIRDRHGKPNQFNTGTDWFSFGIVTFNMFTGLHPYRGNHAQYKTVEERMQHNVSVLNKDVKVPPIVGDLSQIIPANYLQWYEAIFDKGVRCAPPFGATQALNIIQKIVVATTNNFNVQLIKDLTSHNQSISIIKVFSEDLILTSAGLLVKGKWDLAVAPYAEIVTTAKTDHVVSAIVAHHKLSLYDVTAGKAIPCDIAASEIVTYGNRLYIQQTDYIHEVELMEINGAIMPSIKQVANIMPLATKLYDGCAIQNMLGMYVLSIFPSKGMHYQLKLPELSAFRIIEAKFDKGVLQIIAENMTTKQTSWFIYRIADAFDSYVIEQIDDVSMTLNFTVLDNGICISTNNDGHVEVFHKKPSQNQKKVIQDDIFDGNALFSVANNAYYTPAGKLYSVRMK